jgi:hypothetical protein
MCRRIKAMTADSFKPNCASIASNAVRSSQAISTMREILDSQRAYGTATNAGVFHRTALNAATV